MRVDQTDVRSHRNFDQVTYDWLKQNGHSDEKIISIFNQKRRPDQLWSDNLGWVSIPSDDE